MKTAILHVGLHKTGTTSIQKPSQAMTMDPLPMPTWEIQTTAIFFEHSLALITGQDTGFARDYHKKTWST